MIGKNNANVVAMPSFYSFFLTFNAKSFISLFILFIIFLFSNNSLKSPKIPKFQVYLSTHLSILFLKKKYIIFEIIL